MLDLFYEQDNWYWLSPPTSNGLRPFFRGGSLKCGTAHKESKTSRSGIPRDS